MVKAADEEIAALLDISYLTDEAFDFAACNTRAYHRLKHLLSVLPALVTLEDLGELCKQLAALDEFDSASESLSHFSGYIDEGKWSCMCVAMMQVLTQRNQDVVFEVISKVTRLMRKITLRPSMIDNTLRNTITHICQLTDMAPVIRGVLEQMFTKNAWRGVQSVQNKGIIQHCFEVWVLACTQQEQWPVLLAYLSISPQCSELLACDEDTSWNTPEFRTARDELSVENYQGLRLPWVSLLSLCHHFLDVGDDEAFWVVFPLLLTKPLSDELLVDRVWHRNLFENKDICCDDNANCVCHSRSEPLYPQGIGNERGYQVLLRLDLLRTSGRIDTFSECRSGYGLDTLILRMISHARREAGEYVDDWLQDLQNPQISTRECLSILNLILEHPECQLRAYKFLELCCRLGENYFVCDQGKLASFIATFEKSEILFGKCAYSQSEQNATALPTSQAKSPISALAREMVQNYKNFCASQNYDDCYLSEFFLLSVLETYESKCGTTSREAFLPSLDLMVAPKALNLSDNLCESLLLSFYLERASPIAERPIARPLLAQSVAEAGGLHNQPGTRPSLLPLPIARRWSGHIITSSYKYYLDSVGVEDSHLFRSVRFEKWRTITLELLVAMCKGTYSPSNLVAPHMSDSLVDSFVRVYISQKSPRAVHLSKRYKGKFPSKVTSHIIDCAIPADNVEFIVRVWCWSDLLGDSTKMQIVLSYLADSPHPRAQALFLELLEAQRLAGSVIMPTISVAVQPCMMPPTGQKLLASYQSSSASTLLCTEDNLRCNNVDNVMGSSPSASTEASPKYFNSDLSLHRIYLICQQRPIDWFQAREPLNQLLSDCSIQGDVELLNKAYSTLISAALKTRIYTKALEFYTESLEQAANISGCQVDLDSCANLLQHVHFLVKVAPKVLPKVYAPDLKEHLIAKARSLDRNFTDCHLFSAVVEALSKTREIERIVALISDFLASHPKPMPLAVAAVVKAHGRCGKKDEVLRLWNSVSCYSRDEFIQGCLIDALVFVGEFDEALLLWQYCMRGGINLREQCQSVLVRGCITQNRYNEAMTVYKGMLSRNVHPCDVTCNYLMHGSIQVGRLDDALQCFEAMTKWSSPDLVSYSTIIKGLCDKHKVEMAYEVFFLQMEMKGPMADIVTYNTLLEGFGRVGNRQMVEKLKTQLIERGLQPTCYTLTILIKFYGKLKLLDEVFNVYKEMPTTFNFQCDQFVYTSVIAACTWNKRIDLAYEVLVTMREKFSVSSRTYSTVIAGCIKLDAWDLLADVLELCVQDQISLSKKDLNKLDNVLRASMKNTKTGKKINSQHAADIKNDSKSTLLVLAHTRVQFLRKILADKLSW